MSWLLGYIVDPATTVIEIASYRWVSSYFPHNLKHISDHGSNSLGPTPWTLCTKLLSPWQAMGVVSLRQPNSCQKKSDQQFLWHLVYSGATANKIGSNKWALSYFPWGLQYSPSNQYKWSGCSCIIEYAVIAYAMPLSNIEYPNILTSELQHNFTCIHKWFRHNTAEHILDHDMWLHPPALFVSIRIVQCREYTSLSSVVHMVGGREDKVHDGYFDIDPASMRGKMYLGSLV